MTHERSELDRLRDERDSALAQCKRARLETELRALTTSAGLLDTAVSDAVLRAQRDFEYDAKREIVVGTSDATVRQWLRAQRESRPHWFESPTPATSRPTTSDPSMTSAVEVKSMEEWREKRKQLGMGSGYAGHDL